MSANEILYTAEELDFQSKEAVNMLRASVQMAGRNNRVFGITSAMANEGKSSLAFRLAQSLAGLEGKRVVLLDCDIRNSKTKAVLKIVQKTLGLSEYLCGLAELPEILYQTQTGNLDLIFAGRSAPNPSELLSGDGFSELLTQLKQRYDYVVVDMPPANLVVDATIIAPLCDSNILVVECGTTDKREIAHAVSQLQRSGARMLGIVLNRVNGKQNRYGREGYYGHYGKYGKYGKYGYRKYGEYGEKKN